MKLKMEVVPLKGIFWAGKSVRLRDTLEQAEAALGAPDRVWKNTRCYFDISLRLDFSADGRVEFIEFLSGIDGPLQPVIYGVSAFDAVAEDLLELLTRQNAGPVEDSENGFSYAFPNIGVGIWRERTPERAREMVRQADSAGRPLDARETGAELRLAHHWATLGIGGRDYYRGEADL